MQVELDQDLVDLLEELHRPVKQAARELIVLELHRQGEISSGRAAQFAGPRAPAVHSTGVGTGEPILQAPGTGVAAGTRRKQGAVSAEASRTCVLRMAALY